MDLLSDLLKRKAQQIDLDDKRQELDLASEELKRFFDIQKARLVVVTEKTITVKTASSVIASDLRMSQLSILESVSRALNRQFSKMIIRIGRL
jgi:hypothetical protein